MTLVKFNPSRSLMKDTLFPSAFNTMFDRFMDDAFKGNGEGNFFAPKTDVIESNNAYQIEVSLPGLKKEDIKLEIKNDMLTISGERKMTSEENDRRYHRVESSYGMFSRSFQLPELVKKEEIKAEFRDGILYVTLPKSEEAGPKQVPIS